MENVIRLWLGPDSHSPMLGFEMLAGTGRFGCFLDFYDYATKSSVCTMLWRIEPTDKYSDHNSFFILNFFLILLF